MYLAIDPSVNFVGVCFYYPDGKLYEWSLLKPPKEFDLGQKLRYIERQLHKGLSQQLDEVTEIICEYPQFFNNERGAASATKGYTLDLACICGFIAGICKFAKVYYYTPNKWKGNLNKKHIEFRFARLFEGEPLPSEHEQEATMMMHYHLQNT